VESLIEFCINCVYAGREFFAQVSFYYAAFFYFDKEKNCGVNNFCNV
jgi:predicted HAD superfamily phosphohydrolase